MEFSEFFLWKAGALGVLAFVYGAWEAISARRAARRDMRQQPMR